MKKANLETRLEKEKKCGKGIYDNKNRTLYIENIPGAYSLLKIILKRTGLWKKWSNNALKVQIRHETWYFDSLPAEFDDFRILHISDLHLDALPELTKVIIEKIKQVRFDLAVYTGDYRFGIHKPDIYIDNLLKVICEHTSKAEFGNWGILGNHDYLHYTMNAAKKAGLPLLINENRLITRGNSTIQLIALDDVHYYRTGRVFDFRNEIKNSKFNILLVHSPEIYREAALSHIDFYLCGHTHGGQICLPGGKPIISNSRAGGRYNQGRWHYHSLQGYTSCGAGVSGLPLRWNCFPEITIHRLKVSG